MKIYTRTGDSGETALFGGTRVSKADPRVAAYGDVDELNAWLGLVRAGGARRDDCRRCSNRSSAICSPSARGWPIRRGKVANRVEKAAVTSGDVAAARGGDRSPRVRAAAAAPLHPARRIAGGRRAARRADRLPAGRAHDRRPGRRRRRAGDPRLPEPAVRPAVRDGAGREPPGPARPKSSGEPRSGGRARLRVLRTAGAGALRELSGGVASAARARCVRISRRSTRSRARPTTSRTSRAGPSTSACGCSTTMRQRLSRLASRSDDVGRRRRPRQRSRICCARGRRFVTADLPVELFADLLSAFRQDVTTTRYATWADVLDYCRRSANPVGRLVLRVAGYDDPRSTQRRTRCARRLQLANFWQDLGVDWAHGRLYVPADDAYRRRRPRRGSRRRGG